MAIAEHPGWKEFPLEIGQAVRSDQINALWWALSERAAIIGFSPIETNFGIFEAGTGDFLRYRGGSRLCLIKGAGESELRAFEHLATLRTFVGLAIGGYVNPETTVDGDGNLTSEKLGKEPFDAWNLSTILKKLNIGGPASTGSTSDPDPIFTWTRIPDRGSQVIGKDENGGNVTFNEFFGDPEFGPVLAGDPTFKEHLNEIYFVLKELKFIPFTTAFRLAEFRSSDGRLIGDRVDPPDTLRKLAITADIERPSLIANVALSGGNVVAAVGVVGSGFAARLESVQFGDGTGENRYEYAMSSSVELSKIPNPLFHGVIGENNDLPTPYEYGDIRAFVFVFQNRFTDNKFVDGREPASEQPRLKAIKPDDLVEGTGSNSIIDLLQGTEVLSFGISASADDPSTPGLDEEFIREIDVESIRSLLPLADLGVDPEDADSDDFDNALALWFAGSLSTYGGDVTGLIVSTFDSRDVEHKFRHLPVSGFFEITNFTHQDRTRDPLAPNFPSCDTV